MSRRQALRQLDVIEDDVAIAGNNAIVRLRQSAPPLSESSCSCGTRTSGTRAAQPTLRRLESFARVPALRRRGSARGPRRLSQAGRDRRGSIRAQARLRRRHRSRSCAFRPAGCAARWSAITCFRETSDSIRIELPKGSYAPVFVEIVRQRRTARCTGAARPGMARGHGACLRVHCARDATLATQLKEELTGELCRYGIGACHPSARYGCQRHLTNRRQVRIARHHSRE